MIKRLQEENKMLIQLLKAKDEVIVSLKQSKERGTVEDENKDDKKMVFIKKV